MSLLPDGATFEELVQECFLTYRSWGLALSALDSELVRDWSRQDIPFEVVARGIRRSAERAVWDAMPGEPPLRSLRSCRRQVEVEIRTYRTLTAGRGSGDDPQGEQRALARRRQRLRTALRKAGRRWPTLAALIEGLLRDPGLGASSTEQAIELRLVRALPFDQRIALIQDSQRLTSVDHRASAQARKQARRFAIGALIRKKLSLPSFW